MSHPWFLALEEMNIEMEMKKKKRPSSTERRKGDQTK
jgi:hypothetical protein